MKRFFTYIAIIILASCLVSAKTPRKKREKLVLIETQYGNIKVKLYNETQLHKENFLNLVKNHFYDSLIFHRVIEDFMIQGGDPDIVKTQNNQQLKNVDYTTLIPAEIRADKFHKRGALCAARMGDNVNPEKKSSPTQFYLVQGRVFSQKDLELIESQRNFSVKQKLLADFFKTEEGKIAEQQLQDLYNQRKLSAMNDFCDSIANKLVVDNPNIELFSFSPEQKKAYTTIGGSPHLDGDYTVFGEVVDGLNVIDSIAAVETNNRNRPFTDIIMKMRIVKK